MTNIFPWVLGCFATIIYWILFLKNINYFISQKELVKFAIPFLIGTLLFILGFWKCISWLLIMVGFFSFGIPGVLITVYIVGKLLSLIDGTILKHFTYEMSGLGSSKKVFNKDVYQLMFFIISFLPGVLLIIGYIFLCDNIFLGLNWSYFLAGVLYPILFVILFLPPTFFFFYHAWDSF